MNEVKTKMNIGQPNTLKKQVTAGFDTSDSGDPILNDCNTHESKPENTLPATEDSIYTQLSGKKERFMPHKKPQRVDYYDLNRTNAEQIIRGDRNGDFEKIIYYSETNTQSLIAETEDLILKYSLHDRTVTVLCKEAGLSNCEEIQKEIQERQDQSEMIMNDQSLCLFRNYFLAELKLIKEEIRHWLNKI